MPFLAGVAEVPLRCALKDDTIRSSDFDYRCFQKMHRAWRREQRDARVYVFTSLRRGPMGRAHEVDVQPHVVDALAPGYPPQEIAIAFRRAPMFGKPKAETAASIFPNWCASAKRLLTLQDCCPARS